MLFELEAGKEGLLGRGNHSKKNYGKAWLSLTSKWLHTGCGCGEELAGAGWDQSEEACMHLGTRIRNSERT